MAGAASGGGVQLTLSNDRPAASATAASATAPAAAADGRAAKLILTESGQDFTIGGNVEIFGTAAGGEVIEVLRGDILLDASFNLGGDTVVLPGAAGSYTAILSGSFVTISGGDISVAIPVGAAGLAVQFSDSTRTLRFDSGAGEVMLGTQSIGTTAEAVAASGPPLVDAAETGPDSLAKLILTAPGQDVDIGGNVAIFGTASGGEVVNVLEGTIQLDASFNLGGDTVVLPGNANTYTATLSGSFVTIASGDISVAIPDRPGRAHRRLRRRRPHPSLRPRQRPGAARHAGDHRHHPAGGGAGGGEPLFAGRGAGFDRRRPGRRPRLVGPRPRLSRARPFGADGVPAARDDRQLPVRLGTGAKPVLTSRRR